MIIQFKDVHVVSKDKRILHNVNFSLQKGEKCVITGKSGAGKSSILHTILGVLPPSQGEVYIQDTKLDAESIGTVRSSIAYIGQEPVLGEASTVRDALLLPFNFKANRKNMPDTSTIEKTLERLQLDTSILSKTPEVISGGEKQRIAICRGLLQRKTIYLLDEVTSALDGESAEAVMDLFADSGFSFLSVAHQEAWIKLCDTVIVMENGTIISTQRRNGDGSH